jgi:hypothetical protein
MHICEAHGTYIQSAVSRTKGLNVIPFRNFTNNYGHIVFTESYTIEGLEFSVSVFNCDNENVK